MSNQLAKELLDSIQDSDSDDDQIDAKPASDDDYDLVPEKIEWDEDSDDQIDVDAIAAEVESKRDTKKKAVKVKGSTDKPKKETKPRAPRKTASNADKAKPKKESKPKTANITAPPGDCIILQQNIIFGTSLTSEQMDEISRTNALFCPLEFTDDGASVVIQNGDWTSIHNVLFSVESIRSVCRKNKVQLKGNVYMIVRYPKDPVLKNAVIKVNSRYPVFSECKIKVTAVAEKKQDSAKKLTDEEKMELFREFYEEHQKIPEKNEVYKDFKVGQFYNVAMKNKELVDQIKEITED